MDWNKLNIWPNLNLPDYVLNFFFNLNFSIEIIHYIFKAIQLNKYKYPCSCIYSTELLFFRVRHRAEHLTQQYLVIEGYLLHLHSTYHPG